MIAAALRFIGMIFHGLLKSLHLFGHGIEASKMVAETATHHPKKTNELARGCAFGCGGILLWLLAAYAVYKIYCWTHS